MRLIDADVLIVFVEKWLSKECDEDGNTIPNIWIDSLKKCINAQPTAYDVEKVVEQICKEQEREFINNEVAIGNITCSEVIEIVEGGGVNE
ncbi:MAG: hypothetical protein ACI4ES_12195 [Roseburia sp.]